MSNILAFSIPRNTIIQCTRPLNTSVERLIGLNTNALIIAGSTGNTFLNAIRIHTNILRTRDTLAAALGMLNDQTRGAVAISTNTRLLTHIPTNGGRFTRHFPGGLILTKGNPSKHNTLLFIHSKNSQGVSRLFSGITLTNSTNIGVVKNKHVNFDNHLSFGNRALACYSCTASADGSLVFDKGPAIFHGNRLGIIGNNNIAQRSAGAFRNKPSYAIAVKRKNGLSLQNTTFTNSLQAFIFRRKAFLHLNTNAGTNRGVLPVPVHLSNGITIRGCERCRGLHTALSKALSNTNHLAVTTASGGTTLQLAKATGSNQSNNLSTGTNAIQTAIPNSLNANPLHTTNNALGLPTNPNNQSFPTLRTTLTHQSNRNTIGICATRNRALASSLTFATTVPCHRNKPNALIFTTHIATSNRSGLIGNTNAVHITSYNRAHCLSSLSTANNALRLLGTNRLFVTAHGRTNRVIGAGAIVAINNAGTSTPTHLVINRKARLIATRTPRRLGNTRLAISSTNPTNTVLRVHPNTIVAGNFRINRCNNRNTICRANNEIHGGTGTKGSNSLNFAINSCNCQKLCNNRLRVSDQCNLTHDGKDINIFRRANNALLLASTGLTVDHNNSTRFRVSNNAFIRANQKTPSLTLNGLDQKSGTGNPVRTILALTNSGPRVALEGQVDLVRHAGATASIIGLGTNILTTPCTTGVTAFRRSGGATLTPLHASIRTCIGFNNNAFQNANGRTALFNTNSGYTSTTAIFPNNTAVSIGNFTLNGNSSIPFIQPTKGNLTTVTLPPSTPAANCVNTPGIFVATASNNTNTATRYTFSTAANTVNPVTIASPNQNCAAPPAIRVHSTSKGALITYATALATNSRRPYNNLIIAGTTAATNAFALNNIGACANTAIITSNALTLNQTSTLPTTGRIHYTNNAFSTGNRAISCTHINNQKTLQGNSIAIASTLIFSITSRTSPTHFLSISTSLRLTSNTAIVFARAGRLAHNISCALTGTGAPFPTHLTSGLPAPQAICLASKKAALGLRCRRNDILFFH